MRKALQIVLPLLVVVLVTCLLVVLRRDQPYHHGKSLYTWLLQHAEASAAGDKRACDQAEIAISQIGTNALPTLLLWITKKDSATKKSLLANWPLVRQMNLQAANDYHARTTYACGVLKSIAKPIVPNLIGLLKDPDPDIRDAAAFALCQIGPAAQEAVPGLIQSLEDPLAKSNAFAALRSLGVKPEVVVAALIAQLSSTNSASQSLAMDCLYQYGTNATAAAANVLKFLIHSDFNLRWAATNALKKIDPEAASKAGVK